MGLDPIERIVARRLSGIVVGHRLRTPPALAALFLEEGEDRLPSSELEREVRRHADGEVFRLVVDDHRMLRKPMRKSPVNIALANGSSASASTCSVPVFSGGSTA